MTEADLHLVAIDLPLFQLEEADGEALKGANATIRMASEQGMPAGTCRSVLSPSLVSANKMVEKINTFPA